MERQKKTSYKIVVMLFCIIVTAATLNQFAALIQHLINVHYDWKFELGLVIGQLVFQFPFIYKTTMEEKGNYYFNMLQVSAMGSLALLPLILINYVYPLGATINICYFFIVVLLMFLDHKRRVERLRLPASISYTWVLYRFLILIFILI